MKLLKINPAVLCIISVTLLIVACSDHSSLEDAPIDDLPLSEDFPFESKYIQVLGSNMHYIDEGDGDGDGDACAHSARREKGG